MVPGLFRTTREELQVVVSFFGGEKYRISDESGMYPKSDFRVYQELAKKWV